jgi:hypothetical protein
MININPEANLAPVFCRSAVVFGSTQKTRYACPED